MSRSCRDCERLGALNKWVYHSCPRRNFAATKWICESALGSPSNQLASYPEILRAAVRQSVSYEGHSDFTGPHTSPSSYRGARQNRREINPSFCLTLFSRSTVQTKLLPSGRREVFMLSPRKKREERGQSDISRWNAGERGTGRGVDTMPPFYGKKQSPSAFESFPLGKISPSCSGDQINVTPLPRGACRASAFPRKLGLDFFLPLISSWETHVKDCSQALLI